jgi:hypothetical protein
MFFPACVCSWVVNSKRFDEHETAWFEGINESLCDFFAFFLGDVVKDRYRDNGVIKIGCELYGSDVSNFPVDRV